MSSTDDHAKVILARVAEDLAQRDKVTLISETGGESFPISRVILRANSKYFTISSDANFKDADENEFILDGTDGPTVKAIVDFCYTGRINLTDENVSKFLGIASSIDLDLLERKCWDFYTAKLTVTNAIDILITADKYSGLWLRKKAIDLICKSFVEIPRTQIPLLDYRLMEEILRTDTIHAHEQYIFQLLLEWYRKDKVDREQRMSNLLRLIRLDLVPAHFLHDEQLEMVYQKFCLFDAMVLHERDERLVRPNAGIRQRRSIYCLYAQYRGEEGENPPHSAVKIVKFNSASNEFDGCDEINLGKRRNFGTLFHDNKVYIIGGFIDGAPLNAVSRFDLNTGKEDRLANMIMARTSFSSVIHGKYIYVFGGWDTLNSEPMNECERYDIELDTWTALSSMMHARAFTAAAAFNKYICVAGGGQIGRNMNYYVECYDLTINDWLPWPNMSYARCSFPLFKWNTHLYAIGSDASLDRFDATRMCWTPMGSIDNCTGVTCSVETCDGIFIMKVSGEFGRVDFNAHGMCSYQKLANASYRSEFAGQHQLFQN